MFPAASPIAFGAPAPASSGFAAAAAFTATTTAGFPAPASTVEAAAGEKEEEEEEDAEPPYGLCAAAFSEAGMATPFNLHSYRGPGPFPPSAAENALEALREIETRAFSYTSDEFNEDVEVAEGEGGRGEQSSTSTSASSTAPGPHQAAVVTSTSASSSRPPFPLGGVSLRPHADWHTADLGATHVLGHAWWVQDDELPSRTQVAPWHDDGKGEKPSPLSASSSSSSGGDDAAEVDGGDGDDGEGEEKEGAPAAEGVTPAAVASGGGGSASTSVWKRYDAGNYDWQGEAARTLKTTPWRLLLQLNSEGDAGMCWGDVGSVYFVMKDDDMLAGTWTKHVLLYQCG